MKDKVLGLLICIGIILYVISSIGLYILIGLVVIAIISIMVFLSINDSAKSENKGRPNYDQTARTQPIDSIKVARFSSSSIKSNSFVDDQKIIQSLVKAYNEVDNSLETSKRMNKILRYCQRFYSKQAYTKRNLFSFIIEEANNEKQTAVRPRLIRECETIITEMQQLKNGIPIESIINQHTENKLQNAQQLIQQKTFSNRTEVKNLVSGTEELMKNDVESNKVFIEPPKPSLITDTEVPLIVKRSGENDKEYNLLIKLANGYSELDKKFDNGILDVGLMNYIQMFYGKEPFNNKSLFENIRKEVNFTRSTLDRNLQQHDILECERIVDDIVQLKNGVSVESIITKYSESKKQTDQLLIKQNTCLNNSSIENHNSSLEDLRNTKEENITTFNEQNISDTITEAHDPIPVTKQITFDKEFQKIQSLIDAHNKSDNSVDTNNWIIRMLRFVSKFYTKKAFKNGSLFSFIIEEANSAILNAKPTPGRTKLIRECEIIITEIKQLKNGVPIESIINQYTKNKIQNAQQLIQQKTCCNRTEVKNLVSGSEELMKNDVESNKVFIEPPKPSLITDAEVPLIVKRSDENDKEYNLLLKLINAYSESDKTLDISNLSIRLMNYIQMFYGKESYKNKSLFEYIINEVNSTRSNLDLNLQQHDILECEIIVADIAQLRNGVSVESIITKYSESKRQIIPQLVVKETRPDQFETIHLIVDFQENKEEIDESNNSENNCLIKPIDSYRIRASKQVHESVSNDATICSDIPYHEPIKLDNQTEELGKVVGDIQFWNNYYINSSIGNNTASQQEKDSYVFFKKSFLNGIYGLEGNKNYSFILLFDLINDYKIHKDLVKVKSELQILEDKYPKTKGYTIQALEKVMAQDAGIELTSKEALRVYETEPIEPISEELKKIIDPVPFWTHYYVYSAAGLNTATQNQKDFYAFFKHSFLNSVYLDLEGNSNYSFILLFDLIDDYNTHKDLAKITIELQTLGEKYPKTKGYTMPALEKAISQKSGIELLSKEHLILNEVDSLELIKKEENEKNALFQRWNKLKSIRKAEIQNNFKETENPVIVVKGAGENIFSIKKPIYQKPIFQIDADKLLIFEQDTIKSKEMLTEIFSSEVKIEDENSVTKINNDVYLKILALLLTKESWNRSDVERMCKEYNVLLGSALESINDYSYSLLNEAVIDDDGEKMYIAIEYKEQLLCQNL